MTLAAVREQGEQPPERAGRIETAPLPLAERETAPDYPLEALGSVLGEAAERLAYHVQTPRGMAGQSVLAAAALAVQGLADVARGPHGSGPVSLFFLTVAGSGERKSSLDRLALAPIREMETEKRQHHPEELAAHKAAREAWEMRRDSLVSAAKPKGKQPMSESEATYLQETLAAIDAEEPQPPPTPSVTFSEPTAEGIYRHLQHNHPSAGLFSDEGVGFFGGHGMSEEGRGRTVAMVSKLWDGDPITRTRGAAGDSGVLAGRRLSAHLMLQPVVAAKVLGDPLLQGQGFLARFLIVQEPSLVGQRLLKGRDPSQGPHHDPAIARYWSRLSELVRAPLKVDESGAITPRPVQIGAEAYTAWARLHDAIEVESSEEGRFRDVRPFASKAAENAARIATVLALVEGEAAPTVDHIERAGRLVAYYLESMAIRTAEARQDTEELRARELLEWIKGHGGVLHAQDFKRLPSEYRSAKKARPLLAFLVDTGHLQIDGSSPRGLPASWRLAGEV
ncbi:YfjI family protein [Franzmannia qiaohouensis]|uniref:YfjI family protein n=1 Tax=Franzmannia qiaohouensis TaxID=1329370 RepID=A0ABU1HB27_9GAMM|nr:YfjI family protein [Halomonas qiaohouensis]MDR5904004.1 YfjI family protein [Halomonas qiaohouensis]